MGHIAGVCLQRHIGAGLKLLDVVSAIGVAAPQQLIIGHAVQLILVDNAHERAHEIILHVRLIFLQVDDHIPAIDLHRIDHLIAVGPGAVFQAMLLATTSSGSSCSPVE